MVKNINSLLERHEIKFVLDLFEKHNAEGRIVGGSVRDSILQIPVFDIDIAVNRPPDIVSEILKSASLNIIPTGISHGTLSVIVEGEKVEITSLRRDLQTDGRHAKVSFTEDWKEDASRRDFTINALYLDKNGRIYDFFNGLDDLENGIIRFIRDPAERIKEDYLRILRYYRFLLRYGKKVDIPSQDATKELRVGLKFLSKERIQSEIFKILIHDNPIKILEIMEKNGIFAELFEEKPDLLTLQNFLSMRIPKKIDEKNELKSLFRFCCLYNKDVNFFKKNLRLSNKELNITNILYQYRYQEISEQLFFKIRYLYGLEVALILVALNFDNDLFNKYIELAAHSIIPFPLQGKDILKLGIIPGKRVGELLKKCEDWWIKNLGKPNKAECLAFLRLNL